MSVKDAAKAYFDQGFVVIPFKLIVQDGEEKKLPLVGEWKQWQTQPQTLQEFESLRWSEADSYTVLCGKPGNSDLAIYVIDSDVKETKHVTPTTQTEKTSKGFHYIILSKQIVQSQEANLNGKHAAELKGEKTLGRLYPSKGITLLNDNLPRIVQDVQETWDKFCHENGFESTPRKRQSLTEVLLPQTEGNRNQAIFDLSACLRDKNVFYDTALRTAIATNQTYDPPLPASEVKATVQSAYQHPLEERQETTPNQEDWFYTDERGNRKFAPVIFAKHLLSQYHFKTCKDNKTIYIYNPEAGIYVPEGIRVIQSEMSRLLDEATRKAYYGDIEFYIQGVTFFDRPQVTPSKLACLNGILNVETCTLEPFTPNEFILTQIPVIYDPAAECPQIIKFLGEVVNTDQLCMLQGTIGYALYQGMPIHKATMLVGDGANGKSTLIELVKQFLGGENVSNVSLQALCENRFAAAALYGKLANMFADLPDKSLARTGMFKMLSGNDTIMGEEKFKPLFSFKNYAKQIYSCNKVPETHDDTIAFFRRWNIIMCPNRFMPGDPNILAKIATPQELSGLLNYALQGLHDLLEKGEFCKNETTEQIRAQYIQQSNSAKAFIEENLEESLNHTDYIPEAKLYSQYIQYCADKKLLSMKKKDFTTNLKQYMPTVKQTRERVNKEATDVYQYVKYATQCATVPVVPEPLLNTSNRENTFIEVSRASGTTATPSPGGLVCPNCFAQRKEVWFNSQEDLDKHVFEVHFLKVKSEVGD